MQDKATLKRSLCAVFFGAAHLVSSQVLNDLPQCAQKPFLSALSSSTCDPTDYSCLCKDSALQSSITQAVESGCTGDDQTKIIAFAKTICPDLTLPGSTQPSPTPADYLAATPSDTLPLASTAWVPSTCEGEGPECSGVADIVTATPEPTAYANSTNNATTIIVPSVSPSLPPGDSGAAAAKGAMWGITGLLILVMGVVFAEL